MAYRVKSVRLKCISMEKNMHDLLTGDGGKRKAKRETTRVMVMLVQTRTHADACMLSICKQTNLYLPGEIAILQQQNSSEAYESHSKNNIM